MLTNLNLETFALTLAFALTTLALTLAPPLVLGDGRRALSRAGPAEGVRGEVPKAEP